MSLKAPQVAANDGALDFKRYYGRAQRQRLGAAHIFGKSDAGDERSLQAAPAASEPQLEKLGSLQ